MNTLNPHDTFLTSNNEMIKKEINFSDYKLVKFKMAEYKIRLKLLYVKV